MRFIMTLFGALISAYVLVFGAVLTAEGRS